jgi:HPt (histidine-containing phosphotransfer) domain-containing protein
MTSCINLDYLDLMSDGDAEMKKTMLLMLLEELPEEIQKLWQAYKINDWVELRGISHKMKSTLSFVGNEPMTEANKKIEQYAYQQNHLDSIPKLITVLDTLYPSVAHALDTEAGKL